jgi:glycosyltransferase involved in cell wall biosynthesis
VTAADREFLQPFAPQAKIEIVPNIHSLHNRGKAFAERSGLMFIGSFLHRPNRDAVFYFLDEIFPRVLEKIPDARFHIIGGDAPPEIFARNSENVRVEGFVPDAAPFFENCRVFVAPLRYGAGMKGKIGQALSYGLPTVTTAVGAEGMNLQNEREILLADDPAAFAEAVVRAYQTESLWQKLSDDGYRFIEENYSPRVIETKIAALLADGSGKLTR